MKFGGASVKNAEAIRRVSDIIGNYTQTPLLVVVSAIDKTTNQLEELAYLARDGKPEEAWQQFEKIRNFHINLTKELFGEKSFQMVSDSIQPYLEEIRKIIRGILLLEEFPPQTYDRIVAYGELLSTTIVAAFLNDKGIQALWLDARRIIKTDASYKQAVLIWSLTEEIIQNEVKPKMKAGKVLLTQGFIGSTTHGKTTTLGREGSDYSASIFAACLSAESLIVWKDVPGVLSADPRLESQTQKFDHLSYAEAVEMTFYGAQVIHPKTIKPIFNKNIPLHVKSFLDISGTGTVISHEKDISQTTALIRKTPQAFIRITPRDFSFMEETLITEIFDYLYKAGVKVNLLQNSAISLLLCVDQKPQDIEELKALLMDKFHLDIHTDLTLFTYLKARSIDWHSFQDAVLMQWHAGDLFVVR